MNIFFTDKLNLSLTKIEFVTDQFSFFYWQIPYFFTATSTKSTDHFWIVYWFFSNWPINIFTDHFNNFLLTFQLFYWPQNIFPFISNSCFWSSDLLLLLNTLEIKVLQFVHNGVKWWFEYVAHFDDHWTSIR